MEGHQNIAKSKFTWKTFLLLADEHIFKVFPTGALYISTHTLNELSEESLNQRIAHELAHMLLSMLKSFTLL